MATLDQIRAALEGKLQTDWVHTVDGVSVARTPIAWQNVSFDSDVTGSAFIQPSILITDHFRETMTGNPATGQKWTGILQVDVYDLADNGMAGIFANVDLLMAIFREAKIALAGDGSIFLGVPTPHPMPQDGMLNRVSLDIPFEQLTTG